MITDIKEPVWNPKDRCWVIEYIVVDKTIGHYTQTVTAQTLFSAEGYIKLLKAREIKDGRNE